RRLRRRRRRRGLLRRTRRSAPRRRPVAPASGRRRGPDRAPGGGHHRRAAARRGAVQRCPLAAVRRRRGFVPLLHALAAPDANAVPRRARAGSPVVTRTGRRGHPLPLAPAVPADECAPARAREFHRRRALARPRRRRHAPGPVGRRRRAARRRPRRLRPAGLVPGARRPPVLPTRAVLLLEVWAWLGCAIFLAWP